MKIELDVRISHVDGEATTLLHQIVRELGVLAKKEGDFIMGTTDALAGLKAQMAQLQTDYNSEKTILTTVLADVAKLVAGGTTLPNGQVAVAQADIDALVQSTTALDQGIAADTVSETAADASANPPAGGTGTGVNQAFKK